MPSADSALETAALGRARALLATPLPKDSVWPVLCAAAFAASTALMLATAMIMAPPVITEHVVQSHR
ncbi:hypothetical protein [Phenylobacterium aquaticum]|jgi:hypothetical protein|uniref:hypothetical protein n=1 Tax=Phenylobacterium aquaticum TaxID=1763816 RepID=UPI0026ED29B2|nr:hypothetical protein [Phenylobacterium aquaticum]